MQHFFLDTKPNINLSSQIVVSMSLTASTCLSLTFQSILVSPIYLVGQYVSVPLNHCLSFFLSSYQAETWRDKQKVDERQTYTMTVRERQRRPQRGERQEERSRDTQRGGKIMRFQERQEEMIRDRETETGR